MSLLPVANSSTLTPAEPVSSSEMYRHLRLTNPTTDDQLYVKDELIPAAREFVEHDVCGGMHLRLQQYEWTISDFPAASGRLELPHAPLRTVVSIGYIDTAGTTQTLASTTYTVIRDQSKPGYIVPRPNNTWPGTYQRDDAVVVSFLAGYDSTDVPHRARHMVKLVAGDWHENRENQNDRRLTQPIALGVDRLARSLDWGYYG